MRGVLFSREEAARAQQVRTEIGRLLRQHYDASFAHIRTPRRSDQEVGTVRIPVRTGFQTMGPPMSRPDEYGAKGKSASAWRGCWYSAKDVNEITFEPVNWNEADA
jgi:hypothetical protein